MNILILGGGGREHALAWKIARSPFAQRVIAAPGNGGIAQVADCVALDIMDGAAVTAFAKENDVHLVVIGPEAPLAAGVADAVIAAGVACFGPRQEAAQLEASKRYTKEVCDACGAPTASWESFDALDPALEHVQAAQIPVVIKYDGLAAGKGVVVAETQEQALDAVRNAFSEPGARVVVESFLRGEEASLFALTDGRTVQTMPGAQDHKRVFDGDQGPNTGGMGAYSPAPVLTDAVEARAKAEIIEPTLAEMRRRGAEYRGVLYAGLMIDEGAPSLVEYNARFGDPEIQALTLRLKSDIVPALLACSEGGVAEGAPPIEKVEMEWRSEAAITVVMAAKGYPGAYAKGEEIRGLDEAQAVEGVEIFHAGTKLENGAVLSNGGRVLNICALGADLSEARARADAAIAKIDWPGGFNRTDIGWRALKD